MAASCVNEFERLRARANAKFERLRALPAYDTCEVSHLFSKTFAAFLDVWLFQQRNRRALVDHGGLTRPEIGEIAARIGHLHYLWYLRCSDTRSLLESYTFYEAIHARQYFQDSLLNASIGPVDVDKSIAAEQQLRWYARFILVCIMLGKKEEAVNLLQEFQALVAAYSMSKDAETTHEWPLVVAEVSSLLVADPGMPLPRSPGAALSFRPCCRSVKTSLEVACSAHQPVIHHAVLIGYHHRQTKLAELPVDLLRMMQSLEWQDEALSGLDVGGLVDAGTGNTTVQCVQGVQALSLSSMHGSQANLLTFTVPSTASHNRQGNGTQGCALASVLEGTSDGAMQDDAPVITGAAAERSTGGPTPNTSCTTNPPKTLLYRTTAAPALAAMHSVVASMPQSQPAILLIYLSCSSLERRLAADLMPSCSAVTVPPRPPPSTGRGLVPVASVSCLTNGLASELQAPVRTTDMDGVVDLAKAFCLSPQPRKVSTPPPDHPTSASASRYVLTVDDLRPLTRYPLFILGDGDVAYTLRSLSAAGLGYPVLALMSPRHRPSAFGDATRTGQLFTLFLTLPVSAICLITGELDPSPSTLRALQEAVDESLGQIATALSVALLPKTPETSSAASGQWSRAFPDALLRQYMCRFVLARAALAYHRASAGRPECQPDCIPDLPAQVSASSPLALEAVMRIAAVLHRRALFENAGTPIVAAGSAVVGAGSLTHNAQALQAAVDASVNDA